MRGTKKTVKDLITVIYRSSWFKNIVQGITNIDKINGLLYKYLRCKYNYVPASLLRIFPSCFSGQDFLI